MTLFSLLSRVFVSRLDEFAFLYLLLFTFIFTVVALSGSFPSVICSLRKDEGWQRGTSQALLLFLTGLLDLKEDLLSFCLNSEIVMEISTESTTGSALTSHVETFLFLSFLCFPSLSFLSLQILFSFPILMLLVFGLALHWQHISFLAALSYF